MRLVQAPFPTKNSDRHPLKIPPKTSNTETTIVCLNIRSLCIDNLKKEYLKLNAILSFNADFIILLDTWCDKAKLKKWKKRHKYKLSKYDIEGNHAPRRGILIMRNKNSCLSIGNINHLDPDSTIIFDLRNNIDSNISVAACYAPSHKDDDDYFLNVKSALDARPSPYQLMIGDFNTVIDTNKDQTGYLTDPHPKKRAVLQTWEEEEELIDCYRNEHPEETCYTFRTKDHLKKSRLDYAMASPPLMEHIMSTEHHYIDEELTDHSATVIKIDITKYPKGPGVFRAHPLIEQDPTYSALIRNTIRANILESVTNKDQAIHDNIIMLKTKCNLQEELHSIRKLQKDHNWQTNERQQELLENIVKISRNELPLDTILDKYQLTASYCGTLTHIISQIQMETIHNQKQLFSTRKATKKKLNEIINKECNENNPSSKKSFFKAREELRKLEETELLEQAQKLAAFKLLNDELPTKAFINLESKKMGYHEIIKLCVPDPTKPNPKEPDKKQETVTITDPEELRDTMKSFYQEIFNFQPNVKDTPKDLENFLNSGDDPDPWEELQRRKIPKQMRDNMEGNITVSQMTESLEKHLKPSSAPGIDGLTVAWIRVFWPELKQIVTLAINECKTSKELSGTFRTAIFKLLRKGQKDPTAPGNFRPISLLSAFYKIASSVITERMKGAIEHVIDISQKAYVTKNNIGSCLINLLSLMEHVNQKKIASIILLVDFRKAFDSISHNFIQTVLKSLNFGNDICEWVALFFNNRCGYIMMGGFLTEQIKLLQGVPQGDIISPFIFILCVEILLIKITKTKLITGITYGKKPDKANTYADDTTFFMLRSEENLRNTIKILKDFAMLSGLECNIEKTKVVPVGDNFDISDQLCPEIKLEWVDSFTLLGLEVDQHLQKLGHNFDRLHSKCKTIINSWKGKQLTLQGRITIANTLLLSQFTYYCSVLDTITNGQVDKIESLIYNFIQNNNDEENPNETNNLNNLPKRKKRWIPDEIMFTPKNEGGLGCIRIRDFLMGIKISWVRRYTTLKYDDHWTDLLDSMLGVNLEDRHKILSWGNRAFDQVVSQGKIVISELIRCLASFIVKFPSPVETNDNTWLLQPAFFNDNIRRLDPSPTNNKRTTILRPCDYGISNSMKHLTLSDFYLGGIFKPKEDIEILLGETIHTLNYTSLKNHIKSNIGPNKRYEGVPIPNKKVPKHIKQTLPEFINSATKGSKPYRKILLRSLPPTGNINLAVRWKKRLNSDTIDEPLIKHALRLIYNRWIPHKYGDLKARIILGKTQFNSQLAHYKANERDKFCDHCRETILEPEDINHALFSCPFVNPLFKQTFESLSLKDHLPNNIDAKDVILGIPDTGDKKFPMATINTILMIIISYIMKCRFLNIKPTHYEVLEEIKTNFQTSIKCFPRRQLALEIKGLDLAEFLASNTPPNNTEV